MENHIEKKRRKKSATKASGQNNAVFGSARAPSHTTRVSLRCGCTLNVMPQYTHRFFLPATSHRDRSAGW